MAVNHIKMVYFLLKYEVTNVLKRIWKSDKWHKKKLKVFGGY